MKTFLILIFILFCNSFCNAQNEITDSIYKKFPVFKVYNVNLRSDSKNGQEIYEVEIGKEKQLDKYTGRTHYLPKYKSISKEQFEKFSNANDSLKYCRPCIVETYDADNNLLSKSVQNYLCFIGPFTIFNKNGRIKVKGNFIFEDSSKLNIACLSTYHDKWMYFNDSGKVEISEYWNKGEFIKQEPEKRINEAWKVDLEFDDKKLTQEDTIRIEEIKKIKVIPFYKNQSTNGKEITLELELSAANKPVIYYKTTIEDLHNLNVESLLKKENYKITDNVKCTFHIYNNEKYLYSLRLNLIL